MRCRAVTGSVVAVATLAACGSPMPPTDGSGSSSGGTAATTSQTPSVAAVPPASPGAGPVLSGATTLGQRDANSDSEDDPAVYHYRLRYSLDQLTTVETADPYGHPGFLGTRVTASATVRVTNVTPHREVPLNDLSGVMLGGVYQVDRGICHQRHIPIAERGDYCFVSFWTSPDSPGDLAVDQTRQLGDSSPASWDIPPLAKNEKDMLVKDLLSPNLYFVASLSHGYYFVPKNSCTISFDLTIGHAIIDTQPHVNVCLDA